MVCFYFQFLSSLIIHHVTENPYSAAQRFLEQNELPTSYLDEVVRFIEKNTTGVNLGGGSNDFVDPYTGMLQKSFVTSTHRVS